MRSEALHKIGTIYEYYHKYKFKRETLSEKASHYIKEANK